MSPSKALPGERFDVFLAWNAFDLVATAVGPALRAALEQDGLKVAVAYSALTHDLRSLSRSSRRSFVLCGARGVDNAQRSALLSPLSAVGGLKVNVVLLPGAPELDWKAPATRADAMYVRGAVIDLRGEFRGGELTEDGVATVLAAARGKSLAAKAKSQSEQRPRAESAPSSAEPVEADDHSSREVASAGPKIFISYRREDSEGHTGRLYDALARRFGEEQVFMDFDAIPLGVDFTRVITEAVGACDVLIAVIGRGWATITDSDGQRRLDSPEDPVRLEIRAALERDVRVIPAFVQNAQMPPSDQLPDDLASLAHRNGISLRGDSWRAGVERLIGAVEQIGNTAAT